MTKRSISKLAIALAAIGGLVVLAIVYGPWSESIVEPLLTQKIDPATVNKGVKSAAVLPANGSPKNSNIPVAPVASDLVRALYRTTAPEAALAAAARFSSLSPEEKATLHYYATKCALEQPVPDALSSELKRRSVDAEQLRKRESAQTRLAARCAGVTSALGEAKVRELAIGTMREAAGYLLGGALSGLWYKDRPLAVKLMPEILSRRSPLDAENLQDFYEYSVADRGSTPYHEANGLGAKQLSKAFRLAKCDLLGGCDQDSPDVLSACVNQGQCDVASIEELYFKYSRDDFQTVQQLRARIHASYESKDWSWLHLEKYIGEKR